MKKIIFTLRLAFLAAALLFATLYFETRSRWRLCEADRETLLDELAQTECRNAELVAETGRLILSVEELRRYRADDAHRIRSLGIALRRAETVSKSATTTSVEIRAPVVPLADSLRSFEWGDPWTKVCGTISPDSVVCNVFSTDTLLQVVHRVPYRWWFLRWGTKAIRQTVSSSNPHTRIVCSEYIELR